MAQGKQQLKFESNLCSNFRDNRCHRRTTVRRANFDFMSSADIVKQSWAKNCNNFFAGSWETFFSRGLKDKEIIFVKYLFATLLSSGQQTFSQRNKIKLYIFSISEANKLFLFVTPKALAPNLQCNGASGNVGIVQYLESKALEYDRLDAA